MTPLTRSQTEIADRLRAGGPTILLDYLDFDQAKRFSSNIERRDWDKTKPEATREALSERLGKSVRGGWVAALGHHQHAADVVLESLKGMVWLLGRDDIVTDLDTVASGQFGAARLDLIAKRLSLSGATASQLSEKATRMARGVPCVNNCQQGCRL